MTIMAITITIGAELAAGTVNGITAHMTDITQYMESRATTMCVVKEEKTTTGAIPIPRKTGTIAHPGARVPESLETKARVNR